MGHLLAKVSTTWAYGQLRLWLNTGYRAPSTRGHMGSSSARPACGMGDSVLTPMVLPLCRNPGILPALWNSLELGSGR